MKRTLKKIPYLRHLFYYLASTWIVRRLRLESRNRKIRENLETQLCEKGVFLKRVEKATNRILVPLIETSHYQFHQVLLVAKSLQLRGADVKVILCDSRLPGCEVRSIRNINSDPCMNCRVNAKSLVPTYGLETVTLKDLIDDDILNQCEPIAAEVSQNYPVKYVFKGVNIIPMTNDSVTRYYYGAVPYASANELKLVRKRFLLSAMIGVEAALKIEAEWSPTIVFSNLNVYADWSPYHLIQKGLNKSVSTISITPFNYHSVILNVAELYETQSRYKRWMDARSGTVLSDWERKILSSQMKERTSGSLEAFKSYGFFNPTAQLTTFLTIDKKKRNIFLFSNIYWDVGVSDSARLFPDVITWVLDTIHLLSDSNDVCLYIKPHPAEVYDSSSSLKGVKNFIAERFPILPPNVIIIEPEWKVNTYELFPYIDVGVVYNGTLGLEMMLAGIPTVVTGKAPYSEIGIANEPIDIGHYRDVLLGNANLMMPHKNITELFAYFYFSKTCIPWDITRRAYSDDFSGFTFSSLDDIQPGRHEMLDHICNCILDPDNHLPEAWGGDSIDGEHEIVDQINGPVMV